MLSLSVGLPCPGKIGGVVFGENEVVVFMIKERVIKRKSN
jgi:hypothetical protein